MAKKKDKGKAKKPKVMKHKAKTKKNIKKSFFEVSAPVTATKIHLYASSAEELENKTIKLDLTKNLRGKSLELKLKIKKTDGILSAEPESLELAISYLRRVMRKGTDYCEDSFETQTTDFTARVKPLLVTRKRVSRAVLKAIRENAKKHIEAYFKTRTALDLFQEIMTNKFQKQLSQKIKKIYPLALCEIRVFKLLKPIEKKAVEK
ncbi:MAG: hypothetical protein ABIG28_02890 [archaeon]